ncbi:MAG TPA: EcsC family protein [Thermoleophilaceae bacterium]|nr:EcsC family protein [Thermoleophilaceae bacterium]
MLEQAPKGLWDEVRARPDRAPELIALAAAERLAPGAERWAAEHAGKPPADVARRAVKSHIRLSQLEGAALGLAGAWGIVPDLAALAWIESRMVFHVAASYGFDPHHPMRPAELLALQDVYPTAQEARDALDGVGRHVALEFAKGKLSGGDAKLRTRLLKMVGGHVAHRTAAKIIPGVASPIMAIQNSTAVGALGERTIRFYGG